MTIAVIGGGAAGLMAALTAAKNGNRVILLERQQRVGKKLLATGNGRCNLSNASGLDGHYHGETAGFASHIFDRFGQAETIRFFRSLGLVTVTEADGRVYPFSDSAGSVVDVLRLSCDASGVSSRTELEVTAISKTGQEFVITTSGSALRADRVIVCCGGLAGGRLGGSKSGIELLKSVGHSCTKLHPSLVQLKTDSPLIRSLKGIRADAAVEIRNGGETVAASAGEVQFTDYGLSGPAVFEVSRAVSTCGVGLTAHLDLLRPLRLEETEKLLLQRQSAMPEQTAENLLTGILHNRLGRTVVRGSGISLTAPLSGLSASELHMVAQNIKDFSCPIAGTLGFDGAQVTAGGIRTSEFSPASLESRLVPGLYAAGEVLDVDGDCGGFNLQWAWSSGYLAGLTL